MSTWAVVFLAIIAIASLVQAAVLIGLALAGLRLSRRVEALQSRFEKDIAPAMPDLNRLSRNAAEISDLVTLQARRIDLLLADTIHKVDETARMFQQFLLRPLGPLADILAFVKGLRRGMEVYLDLREGDAGGAAIPRRPAHEDDEHLFV